jgi:hypothetical protein
MVWLNGDQMPVEELALGRSGVLSASVLMDDTAALSSHPGADALCRRLTAQEATIGVLG